MLCLGIRCNSNGSLKNGSSSKPEPYQSACHLSSQKIAISDNGVIKTQTKEAAMPTNATTRSRKRCRPPLPPNGLARECRRKSVTDRPGLCRSSSKRCHEPRSGSETIPAIVGLLRSPSPPSIVRLHLEAAVGATGRSPRPPNSHAPSPVPGHPSPVPIPPPSPRFFAIACTK